MTTTMMIKKMSTRVMRKLNLRAIKGMGQFIQQVRGGI